LATVFRVWYVPHSRHSSLVFHVNVLPIATIVRENEIRRSEPSTGTYTYSFTNNTSTQLQSLPSLSSFSHRLAIAAWSIYPLILAGVQCILVFILSSSNNSEVSTQPTFPVLKSTYLFGIRCSALTHVLTMSIIITCLLFPSLFAGSTRSSVESFSGFWFPGWPAGILLPFGAKGKMVGSLRYVVFSIPRTLPRLRSECSRFSRRFNWINTKQTMNNMNIHQRIIP
jgi:hypothetical protein